MSDAEMAHGAGATGRRDEHGRASGPVPRPGSGGEHALQQRLGTTDRADRFYDQQVLDHLNERMQEFVLSQEMFFLATADGHGECDNSFRAGPPGFLRVLDDRTLLYPEYRGNGVHASLGNLQENPHVGLLLMDFLRARIGLHVNGRAEICEDAAIRAEHPDLPVDPVPGRRAQLWVKVRVEEAYIHCAKHIPHLQKVPKGAGRDWGTDDHKRKGGDFFGAARDARERGPVEWQPREHEVPSPTVPVPAAPAATPAPVEPEELPAEPLTSEPLTSEPLPAEPLSAGPEALPAGPLTSEPTPVGPPLLTPAPVLSPGEVSVPPSLPPAGPQPVPPGAFPEEPAPAGAEHQGPRHARVRPSHQTPVAAWRARRQAAASYAASHLSPPGQPAEQHLTGRQDVPPQPGVPAQPHGHEPAGHHPAGHDSYGHDPNGPEPAGPYAYESSAALPHQGHAPGPSAGDAYLTTDGYDTYATHDDVYAPDLGHDETYAAGWHTVGMRGAGGRPRGPVPSGPAPPGVGAAYGASAVIAARAAVPEGEDAEAWRQEAERALADAEQRAANEEPSSFQGWFG